MAKPRQIMPSIISPGLQVTGNLVCDGDIHVEGSIEGDVRARTVTIGQAGTIVGHTTAEQVLVSGKVDGKISAATVILHKSAKVFGDIAHETLTIESGAHFEGHCTRLGVGDDAHEREQTFAAAKRHIQQVSPNPAGAADRKEAAGR